MDRWHVGFVDLSGREGLLGQVKGRTVQAVADRPTAHDQDWRDTVRFVAIDMFTGAAAKATASRTRKACTAHNVAASKWRAGATSATGPCLVRGPDGVQVHQPVQERWNGAGGWIYGLPMAEVSKLRDVGWALIVIIAWPLAKVYGDSDPSSLRSDAAEAPYNWISAQHANISRGYAWVFFALCGVPSRSSAPGSSGRCSVRPPGPGLAPGALVWWSSGSRCRG